jgi:hypothetical protein
MRRKSAMGLGTAVVYVNPFHLMNSNKSSEPEQAERLFLEFFKISAETADDREEAWAYDRMKALYFDAILPGQDDQFPSFFYTMGWAAAELYSSR